VCVWQFMPRD